jgi:hypothetical protein
MHIHVRVHRWVLWWFYVGIVLGAIALINILVRDDLSRTQERFILIIGALHWLLGGIVCYGYGGVRIEQPHHAATSGDMSASVRKGWIQKEWHPASDFLLPGNRKSILPPKY